MVVYYYDAQCPVAQYGECGRGMVKMIPGALSDPEKKIIIMEWVSVLHHMVNYALYVPATLKIN